jgi:hypothetical protein
MKAKLLRLVRELDPQGKEELATSLKKIASEILGEASHHQTYRPKQRLRKPCRRQTWQPPYDRN